MINKNILRFTTAGSVDDWKSTLIWRLLYDSKSIFQDQYDAIEETSNRKGEEYVNLALLTDWLKAEREQGITIDVAYRYFSTPKRKFIIADTPGHIEYTRNMVTWASTADLAIILVDAQHGIVEQTSRHTFIASLLGISHIVFCINKMDLVDYDQEVYEKIQSDLQNFTSKLNVKDISFIPISALFGDNIVDRSKNMERYEGPTLIYTLENINISSNHNHIDGRFPVQYVIRPQDKEYHHYRWYAWQVAWWIFRPWDNVNILPSWFSSKIKQIDTMDGEINEAFSPMSVTIRLEDDIDISRGDMIVKQNNQPTATQDLDLMICRMNKKSLNPKTKYIVKHTSKDTRCIIKDIHYKIDINTLHRKENDKEIKMNDIAKITIRTMHPLFTDKYTQNRVTWSLILIDESTFETVWACMIK